MPRRRDTSLRAGSSSAGGASRAFRRGGDDAQDVDSHFRRLAAQLGLSRQLQAIANDEDVDDDAGDDDDDNRDGEMRLRERAGQVEEHEEQEDQEEEEGYDGAALESPLTPLRSDYSASESLSSDLSLPHSFGNYDALRVARRPLFDDALQRTTQRNTERNASLTTATATPFTSGGGGANDMMRKFYEAQVDKVRAQLAAVTAAHRRVETALADERAQAQTKMQAAEQTMTSQREVFAREKEALQRLTQQLRERLAMEKTHLSDLTVSDVLAEQLARQDEADLSVKEHIQLLVHRKLRHVDSELLAARREIESLQKTCAEYKSHTASANGEVAQAARAAQAREMRLQHELELSEASRIELERQITTLCGQVDGLKDAQAKIEAEASRRPASVDVYTENERLQSELQLTSDKLRMQSERQDDLRRQVDELLQQVALLTADKTFLQDAKRQLEDHEMRLIARNKELQTKADLLAAAQVAGSSALHKVQEDTRLTFEKQLATEIDKFMEMSKREIDTIRSSSQLVYERENRLLKEARDDALKQIDVLQTRLQSVQSSLEEKILEMTRMESAHTSTLASIRNDLKMKHFEMNQLGMTLEERSSELRSATLEIEMLQQKVEVHKEEFARLESTSTMRIAQLEASLETERRRLEEYERLEIDLDDAVLQTGALGVGPTKRVDGANPSGQLEEVMATFGAVPTSTKRRFHQSVQLAQRLVKYQKESMELQRQLDNCVHEKRQLATEVSELKRQLANLHQPQSYLIEKLGRKDFELHKCQQLNEHLQRQLADLRAEYQQTNNAKMALQGQLQHVLSRREELLGLKLTVQALRKKLAGDDDVAPNPANAKASLPYPLTLKNPPSPHVLSQMIRAPTPQSRSTAGREEDHPSRTPPKWHTQLRSRADPLER